MRNAMVLKTVTTLPWILKVRAAAEEMWSSSTESTARGMFSWSGLHLGWLGGWVLYMRALSTAETVGIYAVLFFASNHVNPINLQSLLYILLVLSE